MAGYSNCVRVVATKSYSAIGNAISGIPTGQAIGYHLPVSGMLTNRGIINDIIINGGGSGTKCQVGTPGSGGTIEYTDKLLVYSGVAVAFRWSGDASSTVAGHLTSANLAKAMDTAQNVKIGYYHQQSGPTSFSLPLRGE